MELFQTEFLTQGLAAFFGILVGYLWEKKKSLAEKRKDDADEHKALISAVRVICKIELQRICDYGMEHGDKVSAESWQYADEIYEAYHGLGGNGRGTKLIEKIHEMGLSR